MKDCDLICCDDVGAFPKPAAARSILFVCEVDPEIEALMSAMMSLGIVGRG